MLLSGLAPAPGLAAAGPAPAATPVRQSPDDAWWTGPISISSADTLPAGRLYTEPYLFTILSEKKARPGSLTYVQYGLLDNLTIGLQPFLWQVKRRGSDRIVSGDLKLLSQLRLSRFRPGKPLPTISLVLQRNVPLGRYDRLGPGDEGSGTGSSAASVGVNLQHLFWMPNGRILRGRTNILNTFPGRIRVRDRSVHGSPKGFRGTARHGRVLSLGASLEYSLSREVALAIDVVHNRSAATRLTGSIEGSSDPVDVRLAGSRSITVSPAIEYSWSAKEGVLAGFRYSPEVRNSAESITPVVAFSRSW